MPSYRGEVVIDRDRIFYWPKVFPGESWPKISENPDYFSEGECYFVAFFRYNVPYMASEG